VFIIMINTMDNRKPFSFNYLRNLGTKCLGVYPI
jgi:hypothetical protein